VTGLGLKLPAFVIPLALAFGVELMQKRTGGKGSPRAFSIAGWATLAVIALSLRSAWSCDDWERFGEAMAGGAILTIACFVLASMRRKDEPGGAPTPDWRPERVSRYFRRAREATATGPLAGWGPSTEYAELDHDLFATRLARAFETGSVIKYDETHASDGYGGLGETAVDLEAEGWLRSEITRAEFERVWDGTHAKNR
jgi:hypothetical protein